MLHYSGSLLIRAVRPLARSKSFALRHAVLQLSRPGSQMRIVLLAVGLGSFFIIGVRSLQASLLEQFSIESSPDAPDMFLMDVQRDQAEDVGAGDLEIGDEALHPIAEERIERHGQDAENQAGRGGHERLGHAARQQDVAREPGVAASELGKGADDADDGAEQADHR